MKRNVCWDLITLIVNRDPNEKITDPVAVNSVIKLAVNLNNKSRSKPTEAA